MLPSRTPLSLALLARPGRGPCAAQEPGAPPAAGARQHRGGGQRPAHGPADHRDLRPAAAGSPPTTATSSGPSLRSFGPGSSTRSAVQQGDDSSGRVVLVIRVRERPMLTRWAVKGVEQLSERAVKERVKLAEGRPLDRAAVERGRAGIDSLYHAQGYYAARSRSSRPQPAPGQVGIVFDVDEGNRVAISQVQVEGNERYTRQGAGQAHGHQARGVLLVAEGPVRRRQAAAGHPRAAAGLVRQPRLHRLPGDPGLHRGRLRQRQGRAAPRGRGGAGLSRSAPSRSSATGASAPRT